MVAGSISLCIACWAIYLIISSYISVTGSIKLNERRLFLTFAAVANYFIYLHGRQHHGATPLVDLSIDLWEEVLGRVVSPPDAQPLNSSCEILWFEGLSLLRGVRLGETSEVLVNCFILNVSAFYYILEVAIVDVDLELRPLNVSDRLYPLCLSVSDPLPKHGINMTWVIVTSSTTSTTLVIHRHANQVGCCEVVDAPWNANLWHDSSEIVNKHVSVERFGLIIG